MSVRTYQCPHCGEMNAKVKLCRACGRSMEPATATEGVTSGTSARCPACGAERVPGDKYCRQCGAAIGEPVACSNCGAALRAGQGFCQECGARIESGAGPEAAPAPGVAPSGSTGARPFNGFAIASVVCAVIGGAPLAIIFGYVALKQIDESGGRQEGKGLATAGLIIGVVELALAVLGFLFFLLVFDGTGF